MITITREERDDYAEMMMKRYNQPSLGVGIRMGIEYMVEREKIQDLINTPKPHVAEVVKCGQINRRNSDFDGITDDQLFGIIDSYTNELNVKSLDQIFHEMNLSKLEHLKSKIGEWESFSKEESGNLLPGNADEFSALGVELPEEMFHSPLKTFSQDEINELNQQAMESYCKTIEKHCKTMEKPHDASDDLVAMKVSSCVDPGLSALIPSGRIDCTTPNKSNIPKNCTHDPSHYFEKNETGYTCMYCGEWVNKYLV